jgi:universal stress protein E
MRPIRRILVGVKDPKVKQLPAVTKAAQLARAFGAELVLFQAIPVPVYLDADVFLMGDGVIDAERTTRDACLERLESIARRLRAKHLKVRVSAEWDYPIYEAIIREAGRVKADLIVAERHEGRHIGAGLMHLTDWELLRLSPIPVLLVKRGGVYRRPLVLAAVDPDHSCDKPARLDKAILSAGSAVTKALHGTLHAVHAYVAVPLTVFSNGRLTEEDIQALKTRTARVAGDKLRRLARSVVPESRCHVVDRHAADAIEEVATQTRSALVVMGAISRSGLKRLLIGNTAERVLDHLSCDVLVIKPTGLIKHVPKARRGVSYVRFQSTGALL